MPSQKVLEQKAAAVDALAEKFGRAVSGILVQYQGITVEDDTKLRAAMRAAGVEYTVIKNSLIGRACDKAGFEAMKEHLEGMNAVAISYDDPIAPAKILKEYAEKIETFTLRAGFLDGAVVDEATVKELADIPPKEVLIAKMLGSLQSPISGSTRVTLVSKPSTLFRRSWIRTARARQKKHPQQQRKPQPSNQAANNYKNII